MQINPVQLSLVFPAGGAAYLDQVAKELNHDLPVYGLDTPQRQAHFFAQVRQESGPGLQSAVESLNYSPQALVKTFGYYKRHPDEAMVDGYDKDPATGRIRRRANEKAVANKAYASRNGNGDVASGDGWRFRGRGFIQVTGRSNYAAVSDKCKALYPGMVVDFVADPDAVGLFPGSVRSSVGYWIMKGLQKLADLGIADADVDRITAVINSNTDSYDERRSNFKLALNALK
jgi:putative chitinase